MGLEKDTKAQGEKKRTYKKGGWNAKSFSSPPIIIQSFFT